MKLNKDALAQGIAGMRAQGLETEDIARYIADIRKNSPEIADAMQEVLDESSPAPTPEVEDAD